MKLILSIASILFVLFINQTVIAQSEIGTKIGKSALSLTQDKVEYDPSYFSIPYPNGDVPANKGVCTDVVIRTFRSIGIDLQKEVHLDMKSNFSSYPKNWGAKTTDKNIDHRRVPNLMTYFKRKGYSVPITSQSKDYYPGDIVCWNLSGGINHIGIVSINSSNGTPKIIHNIGQGQVEEDILFDFKIIGHYRYK